MLLPRLELGCAGALEPAPPGLSGANAQEGITEVSVTPFCFCSKSALTVDGIEAEKRWDSLSYETQSLLPRALGALSGR